MRGCLGIWGWSFEKTVSKQSAKQVFLNGAGLVDMRIGKNENRRYNSLIVSTVFV